MSAIVYRAAAADTVRIVALDDFTAIYHRASGITHLVTSPAPDILMLLDGAGLTLAMLGDALAAKFELLDDDGAALAARVEELVASGLVSAT